MGLLECNLAELKCGSLEAFEKVFRSYSGGLERFAYEYVADKEEASDIVQSVFLKLWEKKEVLSEDTRLFNYLITLTKNQCINHLKHIKVQRNYQNHKGVTANELLLNYYALDKLDENKLIYEELSELIEKTIDSLPGQCREIFIMSRFEGLKYQEIADKLGISVKTVEKKMSISLEIMRSALKDYYVLLVFLSLN